MHHRPDLYARWALAVRSKAFFRAGQRVGVAVSGGQDSVLLIHFMKRLAREAGFTISAVHFNHRLRAAESDGDESMVRELAASLNVGYFKGEADVRRIARERRTNIEATARELRYRYFFSLVDQGQLDLVATAHTASDQAETVLMRLLRGTGTRGLGGIYPVLEGKVVRPFLSLTRAEVAEEVAARKISFRVDSSNLSVKLRRNKVRQELLPLLEREYNPQVVSLLNQFANRARDDEACLERVARERSQQWRSREGKEERIAIRALAEFPPAVSRRVLRQMVQFVRGAAHGLTHAHIETLRRFSVEAQSGKALVLPNGIEARKEFSWLVVASRGDSPPKPEYSYPVSFPGTVAVPEAGNVFSFKILIPESSGKGYNQNKLVCLDPQKLLGHLELRNWRAGDSYCPNGSRKVRKVKELFRERKIPGNLRKTWPVLVCENQVIWVKGFPPSRNAIASNDLAEVLVVEEESFSAAIRFAESRSRA